jgi:CO/xanthine dehydrogenase Mo-binding subunit
VNVSDVGRAVNPALVHGQVHGAIAQAHRYALTERLEVREERIINPRLSTYLIPGIGDVAEHVRSVLLEVPDPQGPWGARGMAEMPLIPRAPAIVAAVQDATGVRIDRFPLTPDRVHAALAVGEASAYGSRRLLSGSEVRWETGAVPQL